MRFVFAPIALCFGLASLLGPACSSVRVDSDHDPSIDFALYHTYAWAPASLSSPSDPTVDTNFFDRRVRESLKAELERRGLRPHEGGGEPGLLVAYFVRQQTHLGPNSVGAAASWDYPYGGIGGYWAPVDIRQYKEGTLVIDLIDAKTHQLVWRGVATHAFDDAGVKEKQVRDAVTKLMKEYPPKQSSG